MSRNPRQSSAPGAQWGTGSLDLASASKPSGTTTPSAAPRTAPAPTAPTRSAIRLSAAAPLAAIAAADPAAAPAAAPTHPARRPANPPSPNPISRPAPGGGGSGRTRWPLPGRLPCPSCQGNRRLGPGGRGGSAATPPRGRVGGDGGGGGGRGRGGMGGERGVPGAPGAPGAPEAPGGAVVWSCDGGSASSSSGGDGPGWGEDWEERTGAALRALARGGTARAGRGRDFAAAAASAAAAVADLAAVPDLSCSRHWPAVTAALPGLLRLPACHGATARLLDDLWAELEPSGCPQLLDLFEGVVLEVAGASAGAAGQGTPSPLPPGAAARAASWASALPLLSRTWPEDAVCRLGAACSALLLPQAPHFRSIALELAPAPEFLGLFTSGSMRLERAFMQELARGGTFEQALTVFQDLAFPGEQPVPMAREVPGPLVAYGRSIVRRGAANPAERPLRRPAAFIEEAGTGRAAWLLALLGEAVVYRAVQRAAKPVGRGVGDVWAASGIGMTAEAFCVFLFDVLFDASSGDLMALEGGTSVAATALVTVRRLLDVHESGRDCLPACIAAHIAEGLSYFFEGTPQVRLSESSATFSKNLMDAVCSAAGLETKPGQALCEVCTQPSGRNSFLSTSLQCARKAARAGASCLSKIAADALLAGIGHLLSRDILAAEPAILDAFMEAVAAFPAASEKLRREADACGSLGPGYLPAEVPERLALKEDLIRILGEVSRARAPLSPCKGSFPGRCADLAQEEGSAAMQLRSTALKAFERFRHLGAFPSSTSEGESAGAYLLCDVSHPEAPSHGELALAFGEYADYISGSEGGALREEGSVAALERVFKRLGRSRSLRFWTAFHWLLLRGGAKESLGPLRARGAEYCMNLPFFRPLNVFISAESDRRCELQLRLAHAVECVLHREAPVAAGLLARGGVLGGQVALRWVNDLFFTFLDWEGVAKFVALVCGRGFDYAVYFAVAALQFLSAEMKLRVAASQSLAPWCFQARIEGFCPKRETPGMERMASKYRARLSGPPFNLGVTHEDYLSPNCDPD